MFAIDEYSKYIGRILSGGVYLKFIYSEPHLEEKFLQVVFSMVPVSQLTKVPQCLQKTILISRDSLLTHGPESIQRR